MVKEYLGRSDDPAVVLLDRHERLARARRHVRRQEAALERAAWRSLDGLRKEADAAADILIRGTLLCRGIRRTKRGGWCKMRQQTTKVPASIGLPVELPTLDEVSELTERAEAGDADALSQIRELLRRHPGIWSPIADLNARLEETLLDVTAGQSALVGGSLSLKLEALKAELSDPADSTAEQLLVERVATTWLEVHHAAIALAERGLNRAEIDRSDLNHWGRMVTAAQRRHFAALKALMEIRRLTRSHDRPNSQNHPVQ